MRGFSTPLNVGSAGSGVGTIVNFDLMAVRGSRFFSEVFISSRTFKEGKLYLLSF